jgi:hypothetical protein
MRSGPEWDEEEQCAQRQTHLSAALLIVSAACSQNAPSTGGTAFGTTATGPSELVVPLNFGTHMHGENETHGHEDQRDRSAESQGQPRRRVDRIQNHRQQHLQRRRASHNPSGFGGSPRVRQSSSSTALRRRAGGRHDGVLATGTLKAENLIGPLAGQRCQRSSI